MTDYEIVRERFNYDPSAGILTWKKSPNRKCPVGSVAGSICRYGYLRLTIRLADGRRRNYAAHRIAWLLVFGAWPSDELDHINGVRNDNRIANLRDVNRSQNMLNRKGADRDSSTGLRGASLHRSGKFIAQFSGTYLGLFQTAEAAHQKAQRALIEKTLEPA